MMKEVKLIIDGKEVQLTAEQVKALYEEHHVRENPFERRLGELYFHIDSSNCVCAYDDDNDVSDKALYDSCNYFINKEFAEQVALHQLLYRKLLKFGFDNNVIDTEEWNCENDHWCIHYNNSLQYFEVYPWKGLRTMSVYFLSEEGAKRALKEVVEPFVKEHPEFVW